MSKTTFLQLFRIKSWTAMDNTVSRHHGKNTEWVSYEQTEMVSHGLKEARTHNHSHKSRDNSHNERKRGSAVRGQSEGPRDRKTVRQIDRKKDRDRLTHRQTDRQTDRHKKKRWRARSGVGTGESAVEGRRLRLGFPLRRSVNIFVQCKMRWYCMMKTWAI